MEEGLVILTGMEHGATLSRAQLCLAHSIVDNQLHCSVAQCIKDEVKMVTRIIYDMVVRERARHPGYPNYAVGLTNDHARAMDVIRRGYSPIPYPEAWDSFNVKEQMVRSVVARLRKMGKSHGLTVEIANHDLLIVAFTPPIHERK